MGENIACCGFNCFECPIFLATKNNNKNMKKFLSIKYNMKIESIKCNGCQDRSNNIFCFCLECKIRICCTNKKVQNCGLCNNFPCEIIIPILKNNKLSNYKLHQIFNNYTIKNIK